MQEIQRGRFFPDLLGEDGEDAQNTRHSNCHQYSQSISVTGKLSPQNCPKRQSGQSEAQYRSRQARVTFGAELVFVLSVIESSKIRIQQFVQKAIRCLIKNFALIL